jgi:hypothetical protein
VNAAALNRLNEQRIKTQYELFGRPAELDGQQLTVCHSAIQNNKELRDGGFALMHDFVCRIRKSDRPTPPRQEGRIQIAGVVYRIAEVVDHPASGEWKLGLRSAV